MAPVDLIRRFDLTHTDAAGMQRNLSLSPQVQPIPTIRRSATTEKLEFRTNTWRIYLVSYCHSSSIIKCIKRRVLKGKLVRFANGHVELVRVGVAPPGPIEHHVALERVAAPALHISRVPLDVGERHARRLPRPRQIGVVVRSGRPKFQFAVS